MNADRTESLHEDAATMLTGAVAGAAANRLPIEITLAALAEETNDRRLAKAAQRLAGQFERGASMEQAVGELDRHLSADVAGLLKAGVASGDLAGTMEQLAQQRLIAQRIRRRIQVAVAYPAFILAILAPILLFLSIFVIPEFGQIFDDFDLPLPEMTKFIVEAAKHMPVAIGGMLLFAFVLPFVLRVLGGRWLFHRVRAALPIVGSMWTWGGQREFASLLASFLRLRVPMMQALTLTGGALNDRNIANACRRAAIRLEEGGTLSDSLSQSIHFDRSLVALTTWGERYGLLPEALGIASDLYDDQIEQHATLLKRILPPVTLVSVAALMFFILVSLMVPLVSLLEQLSM